MGISCGYSSGMNTNHINHQMYAIDFKAYYLHITATVTQKTIETGQIDINNTATTLCRKTWTSGNAWAIALNDNKSAKVCKACAAKAGK